MHGFLDLKKTRVHSNNKNLFDVKKTKEYIQIIKNLFIMYGTTHSIVLSVWVTAHFSFMGIEQWAVTLVFGNIFTL